MKNAQQDKLVEQTPNQTNPYLARPEDFTIMRPDQSADRQVPGNGQHGENLTEYQRMLNEAFSKPGKSRWTGSGQDLPPQAKQ